MQDAQTPANRAERRARDRSLPGPARRVRDGLIREWLEGTRRGRAVMSSLGRPVADATRLTADLIAAGHLTMTVAETDGAVSVRIRPSLPALTGRAEA